MRACVVVVCMGLRSTLPTQLATPSTRPKRLTASATHASTCGATQQGAAGHAGRAGRSAMAERARDCARDSAWVCPPLCCAGAPQGRLGGRRRRCARLPPAARAAPQAWLRRGQPAPHARPLAPPAGGRAPTLCRRWRQTPRRLQREGTATRGWWRLGMACRRNVPHGNGLSPELATSSDRCLPGDSAAAAVLKPALARRCR